MYPALPPQVPSDDTTLFNRFLAPLDWLAGSAAAEATNANAAADSQPFIVDAGLESGGRSCGRGRGDWISRRTERRTV